MSDEAAGAFGRIYMERLPLARRIAARALGADEAEDIAQEALLRLKKEWEADPVAFGSPARIKAFVVWTTRNMVKDHIKVTRHQAERQFLYQRRVIEGAKTEWMDPDVALSMRGLRLVIGRTLLHMPEARRECFLRSQDDGATHAEIAAERGISIKTAGHHIAKARSQVWKAALEYLEEGP